MIFLAADTSGKEGSLALGRAEGQALEIVEVLALVGGNFSAQLVPQIAELLFRHGFIQRDIGGFAVATGPGSFTGLRVGLAAIKGLAEALQKPVAAVSRLEAVARAASTQGRIFAALDAGRKQAYVGDCNIEGESAACLKEHLLSWEDIAPYAARGLVATPDFQVAEAVRAAKGVVREVESPRADAIARIGWAKFLAGETADIASLEANYIRRTDAEILVHGK